MVKLRIVELKKSSEKWVGQKRETTLKISGEEYPFIGAWVQLRLTGVGGSPPILRQDSLVDELGERLLHDHRW